MTNPQAETPVLLPCAPLRVLVRNVTLQPPLSRRGHGPGLIIVSPGTMINNAPSQPQSQPQSQRQNDGGPATLDPSPQKKWAEEGYAVVQLEFSRNGDEEKKKGADEEWEMVAAEGWDITTGLGKAVDALRGLESCDKKDVFGLLVYGTLEEYPANFSDSLRKAYEAEPSVVGSISFSESWDLCKFKPGVIHLAGSPPPPSPSSSPVSFSSSPPNPRIHHYPQATSPSFIHPSSPSFHYPSASLSHTRSLTFLKSPSLLNGPHFDLEAIWDEHTAHEFASRSVAATMGTMVDEPYVNHVPTITGGMGRENLTKFYAERFIHSNPESAALELVSRTVGIDRVVDEFVFSLVHDRVVDWLLPGVPPTHKSLRIPFVAVVNIRGDRLYHEHIHWDQGTALRQAGLMPEWLPFPYALPNGVKPTASSQLEYRVPVTGSEGAAKLEDGAAVKSNAMFDYEVREISRVPGAPVAYHGPGGTKPQGV
ncbi:hypothetical protein F5Y16DRAFT_263838 [Xylariaceae sp. FL0255]|nr:hypothetical protein F5Y16DRAFT_263838 [Xylariaceae sp. FL0255]